MSIYPHHAKQRCLAQATANPQVKCPPPIPGKRHSRDCQLDGRTGKNEKAAISDWIAHHAADQYVDGTGKYSCTTCKAAFSSLQLFREYLQIQSDTCKLIPSLHVRDFFH